jgi:hypothetical protein
MSRNQEFIRVMYHPRDCFVGSSSRRPKAYVYVRSPAEMVGLNPTGGMDVDLLCCVLLGRGLCKELIPCPKQSYRLWCIVVCDLESL